MEANQLFTPKTHMHPLRMLLSLFFLSPSLIMSVLFIAAPILTCIRGIISLFLLSRCWLGAQFVGWASP